jgi:large subunit ribosomal protein L24
MVEKKKVKIRKGDVVLVIAGRDKGKTGEVLRVLAKDDRVVVSGINMAKIHKKPTRTSAGQIVSVEKAIHISNVSLTDDGKPSKVGFRVEGDKKVRYFKKSGNKVGS